MTHEIDSNDCANLTCSGEKHSSSETPEDRYVRQVNAMLLDAVECQSIEELSDTLAWGLALIANEFGVEATGEIIQQVGRHIRGIAQQNRAKAEAEETRQKGGAFQ